jgi:short-subunit dehydrogenase
MSHDNREGATPWENVLITGASSGIGYAVAKAIASRGARVFVAARRVDRLQSLVDEIVGAGGRAEALEMDVADADAHHDAVRELDTRAPLDLVIANAGVSGTSPGTEIDWKVVRHALDINLVGAAATICGALPGMVARKRGHVSAVSSLAGWRGLPGSAAYSASKAGIITFLESLRVDLDGSGLAVTAICPGFVKTDMTAKMKGLPFLMEVDRAAEVIVSSLVARDWMCAFPTPTALGMRALTWLPRPVYDAVGRKFDFRRRRSAEQ